MEKRISLPEIESIFAGREHGAAGKYDFFSVLIPLVEKDGELCVLYEVRAESLKSQPGEICFPGGKLEKGESPLQCAVRETCEEIGLKESQIRVINQLDTIHNYNNFTMYCFLGVISLEALTKAKLNEAEVKEVFFVPLDYLLANEPHVYEMEVNPIIGDDFPYHLLELEDGYRWRGGVSEIPIYRFEDRAIWGLTGRVTRYFIKIIKGERKQ